MKPLIQNVLAIGIVIVSTEAFAQAQVEMSRDLYVLIQEICSDSYQLDNHYRLPLTDDSFAKRVEILRSVRDDSLRQKIVEAISLRLELNQTSRDRSRMGLSLATVSALNRDAQLSFLVDGLGDKLAGKEPDGSGVTDSGLESLDVATTTAILNNQAANLRSKLNKLRDELIPAHDQKFATDGAPKKLVAAKWTLIDNGPNVQKTASVVVAPVETCTNLVLKVDFKTNMIEKSRKFFVPNFKKGQKIFCSFDVSGEYSAVIVEAFANEGVHQREVGYFASEEVITKMVRSTLFSTGKTYVRIDPNSPENPWTLKVTKYSPNKVSATFEAEHRADGYVTKLEGVQENDKFGTIICQAFVKQGKKLVPTNERWTILWDPYSHGLLVKRSFFDELYFARSDN